MKTRLFTLDEANRLIPELQKSISDILEKKETYARRHDALFMGELLRHAEANPFHADSDLETEIHQMEEAIASLEHDLKRIRELGCVVRNLERGFIDFLSEHEGEKIYFCWKSGENSIQFYHPVNDRMQKRLPLERSEK